MGRLTSRISTHNVIEWTFKGNINFFYFSRNKNIDFSEIDSSYFEKLQFFVEKQMIDFF